MSKFKWNNGNEVIQLIQDARRRAHLRAIQRTHPSYLGLPAGRKSRCTGLRKAELPILKAGGVGKRLVAQARFGPQAGQAGFTPAQRTTLYEILGVYEEVEAT